MKRTSLEVRSISKQYQNQPLLKDISFSVFKGETVCLLGPSGGGKSTLLRIIAGLEPAEKGSILWNGKNMMSVPPHQRNFGLMFQDYALFPHMTVSENIAFGLEMRKKPFQEIRQTVENSLDMVRMSGFEDRRVIELSGGEQQRIALARALAPQPELLMLDEPLGALDRTLRDHLMDELRSLLHEIALPVIYVTHDQQEAFTIADRLLILHDGRILQSASPAEVYSRPASPWLAEFFGFNNQIDGKVSGVAPLLVDTNLGEMTCEGMHDHLLPGDHVVLVVKPGAARNETLRSKIKIEGMVKDCVFAGEEFRITLACKNGNDFDFILDRDFCVGQRIELALNPKSILCYKLNK